MNETCVSRYKKDPFNEQNGLHRNPFRWDRCCQTLRLTTSASRWQKQALEVDVTLTVGETAIAAVLQLPTEANYWTDTKGFS